MKKEEINKEAAHFYASLKSISYPLTYDMSSRIYELMIELELMFDINRGVTNGT